MLQFEAALRHRAPHLAAVAEQAGDEPFLTELFVRCSPLGGVLPPPMLLVQARMQRSGHAAAFPHAQRYIVRHGGMPIGRIAMASDPDGAGRLIDIAVLPEARGTGAGLAMLRAWLAVARDQGRSCRLQVLRDNPAIRIYRRLGFVAAADDGTAPALEMVRPRD